MARIVVKLHGQHFATLDLANGQEYTVGRGTDCAIVLQEHKGISRQHLKLFQQGETWTVESLSRYVPLQQDGNFLQTIDLKKDCIFSAPPYEFHFETGELAVDEAVTPDSAPKPYDDEPAPFSNVSDEEDAMTSDTVVRGNLEMTVAGQVSLVPYLRVHYKETDQEEVLRLEGELWIAGRDSASEIPLRDSRISRRHFELAKMDEGFFVIDLGSANGTKLNGEKIPPHEPIKVESGDKITVLEITITLEVHDTALASRLQQLPSTPMLFPQHGMMPMYQAALPPGPSDGAAAEKKKFKDWKKIKNWKYNAKLIDYKKHKVRIALGVLAPVLLIGLFSGGDGGRNLAGKANEPAAYEKLSPEQKNAVKDTFSLARNLYMQGKYELCLAELAKLHEMIPMYENSKEVEAFCNQGRDLVIRQKDIDDREKKKALLEQQITNVVEGCREKLKDHGSVDQVRDCLAPAMELNPEHPAIAEMIGAAQGRAEEGKVLAKERAARRARMQKGEASYQKAKSLYKQGHLAKSIQQYQKFIETPYPDLSKEKGTAQREVASIRGELNRKVTSYLDQCKSYGDKNQYKEAYLACEQAKKEDPDNESVKAIQQKMLSSLRRDLKSIYEDSVLEESLGNVDSAKEKWKKIIKDDLDFDEYAKKARTLLLKYGVEM
jgi:pSer/pThr/pTyr-binding forkhead associated (FHA) protein/tetratricopeptide (TPR) repeat protein